MSRNRDRQDESEMSNSTEQSTSRPKRKCSLGVSFEDDEQSLESRSRRSTLNVVASVVDDDDDDDDFIPLKVAKIRKKSTQNTPATKVGKNGVECQNDDDSSRPSTSRQAQARGSAKKETGSKKAGNKNENISGGNRDSVEKEPAKATKSKGKKDEIVNNNEIVLPVTTKRRHAVTNINLLSALFSCSTKSFSYEVERRSRSAVIEQVVVRVRWGARCLSGGNHKGVCSEFAKFVSFASAQVYTLTHI
jgi:hypothetical protein